MEETRNAHNILARPLQGNIIPDMLARTKYQHKIGLDFAGSEHGPVAGSCDRIINLPVA
jgi:hypothetical protein